MSFSSKFTDLFECLFVALEVQIAKLEHTFRLLGDAEFSERPHPFQELAQPRDIANAAVFWWQVRIPAGLTDVQLLVDGGCKFCLMRGPS